MRIFLVVIAMDIISLANTALVNTRWNAIPATHLPITIQVQYDRWQDRKHPHLGRCYPWATALGAPCV